jgi:hypothetical protein
LSFVGFSTQRRGFSSGRVHVGIVAEKMALAHIYFDFLAFLLPITFPLMFRSTTYRSRLVPFYGPGTKRLAAIVPRIKGKKNKVGTKRTAEQAGDATSLQLCNLCPVIGYPD